MSRPERDALPDNKKDKEVTVVRLSELAGVEAWWRGFSHLRKDHRYYEIVEETICPEFKYRYFAIKNKTGEICAIQPFFVLDQDLLAGAAPWVKVFADAIRRLWPHFLTFRTLMVGCAAGEGHLYAQDAEERATHAEALAANILRLARQEKASLIVLKEFPAQYRKPLSSFLTHGFSMMPSMPMTRLDISQFASFDDYLAKAIKAKRRTEFRRKFKAAEQTSPIEFTVSSEAEGAIDDIYGLYEQVYDRSALKFEKLTKAYFREICGRMPDKTRFFKWRQNGKLIAFSLCMVEGETLYGEYLGLDYAVALRLHLYFYVMRGIISWAIANGFKSIVSTSLGYAPKLQMRYVLEPLDLYIRHASPPVNAVLRRVLPWLDPTRHDETLKRFPNYGDLRPDKSG